jgi:tetratricopeptide (TPR) repeat protein
MKKKFLLLSITLLSFLSSFSQFKYLKQAKEAINEKKYEVAVEKIETYQKKEGINTGFYYLKFLLNNAIDNDINKVDSANFYLTLSINEFSKLSLKEKENICKELEFCEANNSLLTNNFENKVYRSYCDNKSEANINLFLEKYPYNPNYAVAEILRDSVEFERTVASASPKEIEMFIKRRPNSIFINSAYIKLHEIEFNLAKQVNKIGAFENFIETYPDATQVKEAIRICAELAYEKTIEENTETAFENYLTKYPNSLRKTDVENRLIDLVWSRIKNNASIIELNEFIKKFPKSEFVVQAKQKIELLSWEQAIKENSETAFEAFIADYPKSDKINDAKAKIQNIKSTVLPYLTTEKKYKLYNLAKQNFVSNEAYDEMYLQKNGLIIISNYKKYGVIDCSGNAIIPATYDCISSTSNAFIVSLGDKYGVIDLKGTKILPIAFDNISLYYDSLYSVQIKKNDTTYDNSGLYDLAGNKIFDCNYTSIQKANNNLFILNSPTGYFIATKQGAISKKYSSLTYLKDDLFVFELLKKQGVVNAEGKIIIPATYKNIRKLDENYLNVTNATDREGAIDYNGNVILAANYYNITKVSSELLLLDLRKKYDDPIVNYKLYNINKKEYYNGLNFDQMLDIQEGFIAFSKNDKLGYMDSLGNIKVQPIFSSEILASVYAPDGHDGIEEGYEKCYSVNENLDYTQFEFFNEYNLSPNFSSGLATVQIGNQYGYINTSGDITIPIIYDMAYPFHDQTSIVAFKTIDEKYNYNIIDQLGRKLVENITPVVYYDQQHFLMYKLAGYYYKINTINHEIDNLNISDDIEIIYLFKNNYYSIYKGCDVYIKKEGGIALMDRNIDFSEYDLSIKIQKGESLFYQQKYSECFDIFESIIQKNPNHYQANLWLGKTYVAQKNYYAAKAQFQRCLEINPSNIEPLTETKEMNYEQKNWREFIEDMEKLKLRNEYSFSANDYFRCGYAYVEIYNKEEALNNYNMAIYNDPQMGSAYNNRGNIYLNKGNKSQALSDYNMALKCTPKTDTESLGLYYSNRGSLYSNMNKKAEACADYKKGANYGNQNCKNMLRYCK